MSIARRGDGFVRAGVTLLDEGVTAHILLGVVWDGVVK